MSPVLSCAARVRLTRMLLVALIVPALVFGLPGIAQATVPILRSTGYAGQSRWTPDDREPMSGELRFFTLEVDQRRMGFGEQTSVRVSIARDRAITAQTPICGTLVFEVTRYQAYSVYWTSGGQVTRFLYRGGLVADGGRPFVGVFWAPGNKLEIRTYNRRADGTVHNAWTAASATGPRSGLVLNNNGLWTQDQRTAAPWLTGRSAC